MERLIAHAQLPAVQPHQIGGVGGIGLDLRDALFTVVHHIVKVGGEIGKQLVQPLIALVEGRLHGGEGEGVVPVDIHVHPELVKDLLFVRVGEHHCAGLQAGQVEGLGARDAGDDVGGDLGGQGGSGDVLFAVEDQVGVDLVGDHQHVMLQAQFHHPAQLLFRPDMAQGVVGGAQQEQVRLLQFLLKVCPVNGPLAVLLHELILQNLAVPCLGHIIELGVHRRLNQDAATLRGEQLHAGGQGLHHAQAEAHEGLVDIPAVAALLPAPNGLKIAVRPGGIAPDALLGPGLQGVDDGLGGLEVHVRDPQGDHVLCAEFLLPLVILGGVVPGAVHHRVKLVGH